jgi:WD40 repeat protein
MMASHSAVENVWNAAGEGGRFAERCVLRGHDGEDGCSCLTHALRKVHVDAACPVRGHAAEVRAVSFSQDGEQLATCSDDKSVILWGVREGPIHTLKHTHFIVSLAFAPHGQFLASASHDRTVLIWELGTGHCVRRLEHAGADWDSACLSAVVHANISVHRSRLHVCTLARDRIGR